MRLGNFVRNASREAVVEGVIYTKLHYLSSSRLISKSNPLEVNSLKFVKKHADVRNTFSISSNQINTYLGASALAHLLDGWKYLSESFNALLNGDEGASIHLAYYSELRSAMSLLASEGIGVFNDKHLGVFANTVNKEYPSNYYKVSGGYEQPKCPTHTFVWDAIEKWSNSSVKPGAELLKSFKVKNKNFYELTEFFHPSTAGSTLLSIKTIKGWLKSWCFDIKSYKDDRQNRNNVSYRPQRIKNFASSIDFKEIISGLNDFWSVISPSATDKFSLLDLYLLRKLFKGIYDNASLTEDYKNLVENAFIQNGIYDAAVFNFLDFQAPFINDHIIFNLAATRDITALAIIARATLMLRVSIGLVSLLYQAGGINKGDLQFIWNNYGESNGFWSAGSPPSDFKDLWFDVQPLFADLNSDLNTAGNDNSLFSIRQRNPKEIILLGQINRACLWGLDF